MRAVLNGNLEASGDLVQAIEKLHRKVCIPPPPPKGRSVYLAGSPEEIDPIVWEFTLEECMSILVFALWEYWEGSK